MKLRHALGLVLVWGALALAWLPAQAQPPTPLPPTRGWFSAVPITPSLLRVPAVSRSAASAVPEVYDLNGLPQTWAWVHQHYGNTNYLATASLPQFVLRRVDATVGPAVITVRVVDAHGFPLYNQPVFLSWPGIDCTQPDPNIKPIDAAYKTRYQTCGIMQRTDTNGYTGFGMSGDWYYRNGDAPGIIWIGSPTTYSWVVTGIGMLGGTNHEGPLSYTFQEASDAVTPTPVPGITPTPDPATDLTVTNTHLVEIRDLLQQILDRLTAGKAFYIPQVTR